MARPNKYGEITIPTTFRIPKSKVKEVSDVVNKMLEGYEVEIIVVPKVKKEKVVRVKKVIEKPKDEVEKVYKDTLPEYRTVNFPDECPNCRFTTIPKTGARLRMTMCLKCKDEKKKNK